MTAGPRVLLTPWSDGDLGLLRAINTAPMKRHLGGPESEEQMLARHRRYLRFPAERHGCMFSVRLDPDDDAVGSVGYGSRWWGDEQVYEMGWNVLPPYQGRGIAGAAAVAAAAHAAANGVHRWLHAFPSVGHAASNAVCRRAGFELVGECDFEFPPGQSMRSNDWRLSLQRVEAAR